MAKAKKETEEIVEIVDGSPTGDSDSTPEPKPERELKEYDDKQDHIIIDVRVTTLDGKASSRRAKIINPTGCVTRSQVNNPDGYFQTVFGGLVKKYGAGHIK